FRVVTEAGSFPIQRHYVDKELRGIPSHQLSKVLSAGAYLQLNKHDKQDEYSLRLHGRLPGGGPFGAWAGATLGYGLVTFVGHGVIELVSVCTGPAYVPVSQTLHKMLAAPIHSAAVSVGIAGGIAGGVLTGPA
ncbi:MAG TPA: hypothetical protein VJJ83_00710, partial [Candidatus Babeliales bacterium]|nr:hypothetical protein [Candidatus Babeliales bacterium]